MGGIVTCFMYAVRRLLNEEGGSQMDVQYLGFARLPRNTIGHASPMRERSFLLTGSAINRTIGFEPRGVHPRRMRACMSIDRT